MHLLVIDCLQTFTGAVSTVWNTCVFVMRIWVGGHDKRFTQYTVRIPAETPNACVVDYLHIPAKTPTQVATQQKD